MDIFFTTSLDHEGHALPVMVAIMQPEEKEVDYCDVISSSLATYTATNWRVGFAIIKGLSLGSGELVHASVSPFMANLSCSKGRIVVNHFGRSEPVEQDLLSQWANDIYESPHSMLHFTLDPQGFAKCERCYNGLVPADQPSSTVFI